METEEKITALIQRIVTDLTQQSQRYFEIAAKEFASQGPGSLIIFLKQSHLSGEQGCSSCYLAQKHLESYASQSFMTLMTNHDPTKTFLVCIIYTRINGTKRSEVACIGVDAHLTIPQVEPRSIPILNSDRCNTCAATSKLLKCERCKCAAYCNKTCQKKDWPDHKRVCAALQI